MVQKCGLLGGTESDLTIDYKITVSFVHSFFYRRLFLNFCLQIDLKILLVNISPSISNSFSLACPFDSSELEVSGFRHNIHPPLIVFAELR